jgi:hypothetical protein
MGYLLDLNECAYGFLSSHDAPLDRRQRAVTQFRDFLESVALYVAKLPRDPWRVRQFPQREIQTNHVGDYLG